VLIIDAGPRPDPQADARIEVHGREAIIAGMSASLDGVHTAHNLFLPEITIDDDTHAHAIWGLHDYVKTPVVNFNGYGHISHDYVKVDGQWQIIRGRTTRLIVDEEWLPSEPVSIEQQVRELADRTEIEQLVTRYVHAVRKRDIDTVMSLFADGGASVDFESAIEGTAGTHGTDAVKEVYEQGIADLQPWPMLTNHLIEFHSPTEASGEVLLQVRSRTLDYQVTMIGVYHDTYVKQAGVWKFKTRKSTVTHTPTFEAARR
jgi:SnoaL-like domain